MGVSEIRERSQDGLVEPTKKSLFCSFDMMDMID